MGPMGRIRPIAARVQESIGKPGKGLGVKPSYFN